MPGSLIKENSDVTKVNSIHLIRLIAGQLADEFLSVFVLDINGLVGTNSVLSNLKFNLLDMW